MRAVYRLLLFLYPAAFRRRYRDDLLEAFECERQASRFTGVSGAIALWRHLLTDLVASAGRLRLAAMRRHFLRRSTPRLPDAPRGGLMDTLLHDVRYSFRQFARRPGFAAVAILSLALAIGGNSLIFGLLDGYVFNPFPYPEPDRFVAVGVAFPKVSSETTYIEALSPAEYADIRTISAFSRIAAFDLGNRNISGGDVPERVFTALVLDDLFPVLGMRPHLGRGFTAQELAPGAPPTAIISHRLWQSRFGGDPRILDRGVRIGGQAAAVVGVMPPGLVLVGTDLWIPWGGNPLAVPRNVRQFSVIGRLSPGASIQSTRAELAAIAARIEQAEATNFKEYAGWRLVPTPWAAALMQDLRPAAFILLCAIGFVLLIACANLANLMLARSTIQTREIAVRLALGAGRWRVARQLLIESAILAFAGALLGLGLANIGLRFADGLIPNQFAMLGLEAGLNPRVLAWSIAIATTAALLIAVLPALQTSRTDPQDSLKSDPRAGLGRFGTRVRHALVVSEIALSVVLLLGAGLLIRSFLNIQRSPLGFEPRGILTMRLTLPQQKYRSGEAIVSFFEELTRRVKAVPGVNASAMASQFPPLEPFSSQIEVEGVARAEGALPTANTTIVSHEYFTALQIPVLRGRSFSPVDDASAPRHIVVNQAFATRYLGTRDPLSTRVRIVGRGSAGPWTEIVGVVADARNNGVAAPFRPEIFIPMEQGRDAWNQLFLLVRSELDSSSLVPSIRSVVASIDPEQPVYMIQTMEQAVALSSFQERIASVLLAIFAVVAMMLAAVGIYGVMSYSVSARTQEIGIRMAVGAERLDVMRLVLLQVSRLVGVGLVIGIALLQAGGRALSRLLTDVTPFDPLTILIVSSILACVALVAGWVPARRASRINPIEALRYE